MYWPLVAVAVLFLVFGAGSLTGTEAQLDAFTQNWHTDQMVFVQAEKVRVEGFAKLYSCTIIGAALSFLEASALLAFSGDPQLRTIAIVLTFPGAAGFTLACLTVLHSASLARLTTLAQNLPARSR